MGLFVEAEILGRRVDEAVILPRAALRPDGPRAAGTATACSSSTTTAGSSFRPVEVLRSERERVVIGGGLAAGERVCVSPLRAAGGRHGPVAVVRGATKPRPPESQP